MLRCTRLALLLSTVAFIAIIDARDAKAGCTPVATAGGDIIVCDAATPPNPSGPFNFLGGDDNVTVNSGTYTGPFTFPSGNNTLIYGLGGGAPILNGTILFGGGNDRMEVHSGTITGNIDQGGGVDTFIMTGGTIVGNLEQSGGFDIFFMSGGTITGAFIEGDDITITGGSVGSVNMNIGNNIFRMSGGTVVGDVIAFGNDDTFILSGTAFIGGNVDLGNGDNSFTVTGGQIVGNVSAGPGTAATPGNDKFTWDGGGVIGGAINLGAGNDIALLRNLTSANLTNTLLDGGSGTDQLTFDNVVSAGIARYKNWESIIVTNGSKLTLDGNLVLGDGGSVLPGPTVVPPTNTGALSIDATSTLFGGNGVNPSILPFTAGNLVTVTNAGTIDLTNGGPSVTDTFTIVGNYVGAGGFVNLNTVLSTDGSPSDRLILDGGTATGSSLLRILNAGGGGAEIVGNGIVVVDTVNGGTTLPSSFGLAVPVAAGPYAYTLHRSSVDASNAEAWYLRSTIDCALDPGSPACVAAPTPGPTAPNYRPETSLYAALPALTLLYGRTLLDTLHERMGVEGSRNTGQWGRVTVLHGNRDGDALGIFGSGPKYAYDFAAFQAGLDLYRTSAPSGARTRAGAYVAFGGGRGDVTHFDGTGAGHNSMTAMSVGTYWTHFGPPGWYVDGVLQATWYDAKGASTYLPALETEGAGLAASIEGGLPVRLAGGWVVEPQIQAVFQNIDLHDGNDGAASVRFQDVQSLAGRIGVRVAHTWSPAGAADTGQVTLWLRPNLWHEFLGDPVTSFSSETGPIPFHADFSGGWAELNAGITAQLTGAVSLFANASYQRGLDGDSRAYDGKLGFRIVW